MSVRLPECKCPTCGHKNDGATGANCDCQPRAGDLTICFYCGSVCLFTNDLMMRLPTAEEKAAIKNDPILVQFLTHIEINRRLVRKRDLQ